MTYVIHDMPVQSRPRERLLAHGPEVLSDAELLAIVLGTGTAGKNAIYLAQELLIDGISRLGQTELTTLVRKRGIGPAKAARVAAMLELSRRMAKPPEKPLVDTTALAAQLVKRCMHLDQERFGVAIVDGRHRVIKEKALFIGAANQLLVSARDIVRFALLERAVGVVVYHNHPSGDPTPSESDVTFSQKLKQALALVDLQLVDHLVIGAERYVSMKARGNL